MDVLMIGFERGIVNSYLTFIEFLAKYGIIHQLKYPIAL